MKTRLRNVTCVGIVGLFIIGMWGGCASVEQKIDDWQSAIREKLNPNNSEGEDSGSKDGQEVYFLHTSQWSWETLAYVAEWYTGNSKNSEKLAEINPYVNPAKIAVGSEVFIPVSLLKTREPLPKNFSGEYRRDYYKHTVRWTGESLSLIATWYTGTSKNWRKLAKANPRLNPNRIKSGDVIVIPPALLKTRAPLPQKIAAKYTSHYFAYKVKADNEKLEDIARWYTGSSANRNLLAKANPDLNPDHLTRGNEVYIPRRLLKTRQPAKASEPAATLAKPAVKAPASEPKTQPAEDENIKLFGPKQHPKQ
ncbi:hypothetical protein D1BOALGB6SA_844 [Olavius sp. associated proteobacterium Delta 1]|nr:hypothetical protein D1BOALGB6SA_844 [Olavius sp. associated proteobacterium Delta 1]